MVDVCSGQGFGEGSRSHSGVYGLLFLFTSDSAFEHSHKAKALRRKAGVWLALFTLD